MPRRINDQNIVIVEDDPLIREALEAYFGIRNSVTTFPSGEDILAVEDQLHDVNVFIFDYKLPGKNGVELFQHLRELYPAAKFILITGEMSYDMVEKTRQIGVDALMLKPFDARILEDNISGLLSIGG